jgi:hypothetical protein
MPEKHPLNEVRMSRWGKPIYRAEAVAAAQVIVTLNETRGRETEQWIKDLAAEDDWPTLRA